jgi:DNA mismatch repair protein MutS2
MPRTVIEAARENLTDREQQLAEHLARVDHELRRLADERRQVLQERTAVAESERKLRAREEAVREREAAARRRIEARLDDQLRDARRNIDAVMDTLKMRAAELRQARRTGGASTGDGGALRTEAREAIDRIVGNVKRAAPSAAATAPEHAVESIDAPPAAVTAGVRVAIGTLGLEGTVVEVHGKHAEVDVRGKRLRADVRDLRPLAGAAAAPQVRVNVDLQPRVASLAELNVIGCTVDEALGRLEKFLDDSTVTDQRTLRIIHGHGTGQLRRGIARFLEDHPLVAGFAAAPNNEGGGGVTVVELKD